MKKLIVLLVIVLFCSFIIADTFVVGTITVDDGAAVNPTPTSTPTEVKSGESIISYIEILNATLLEQGVDKPSITAQKGDVEASRIAQAAATAEFQQIKRRHL
jgi:hypothetical protein